MKNRREGLWELCDKREHVHVHINKAREFYLVEFLIILMTALKPASWLQDFIKIKNFNCFTLGQLELKGHILKYHVSRQWRKGNHLNYRLCFCMESTFFLSFSKLCFQIPKDIPRPPPPFLRNKITLIVEAFFFARFPHLHWDF